MAQEVIVNDPFQEIHPNCRKHPNRRKHPNCLNSLKSSLEVKASLKNFGQMKFESIKSSENLMIL